MDRRATRDDPDGRVDGTPHSAGAAPSLREGRIHNFWIQMSSCATMIKLWLTLNLYVSLVGFVLRMILTLSDRRLAAAAAE